MRASLAAGADRIEVDVRRAADGTFYLRHPDALPDGRPGERLTRPELLAASDGGEPLALLDDVLELLAADGRDLVLDAKRGVREEPSAFLDALGAFVVAAGAVPRVIVASHDHGPLARLRAATGVRTRAVLRGRLVDLAGALAVAGADEVAVFYADAQRGDVAAARALGLVTVLVDLWRPDIARAVELGVDVVSAGYPAAARAVLGAAAAHGPRRAPADAIPLLAGKDHAAPSVFLPEALLREGRRQRGLPSIAVPAICLLDPDGDIVRHLRATGASRPHRGWACYHTELDVFDLGGREVGVVGHAVGGPFAVLVAEQLRASGCDLLVSVTSAGRIGGSARGEFVLIDRAVRDEGTSHHYLPAGREARLRRPLARALQGAFAELPVAVAPGTSWTTDAPYRETQAAVDRHAAAGVACVEMEAAALYAYAEATGARVVCVAHLTNEMGRDGDDFEKGVAAGAAAALAVVGRIAERLAASVPAGSRAQ